MSNSMIVLCSFLSNNFYRINFNLGLIWSFSNSYLLQLEVKSKLNRD